MNKNTLGKTLLPHLIAVVIFTVLTWVYLLPQLQGKELAQHDIVQSLGMQGEINAVHEKTGHYPLWTGTLFSGMPAYMIMTVYPSSLVTYVIEIFKTVYPETAHLVFLLMLGFYVLMFTFTKNPWVSVIAAIGFAFSSYNFVNIDAGHTSKVRCIAFMAPILAGFLAAYRGRYLFGAAITALVLAMQVRSNHFQITYYTMLAGGMIGVFYFILAVKEKQIAGFAKATGALLLAIALGIGSNVSQLWTTYEYSKETIRGGTSEISDKRLDGLDPDYAFSWSYGIRESLTLIIPKYMGGASQEPLSENSHLAKELLDKGVPKAQVKKIVEQGAPTYWGDQAFTSGPTYFGAITCFLFVLGLFLIRNPVKWVFLAISVLTIMLAWGGNFLEFNMLFFNYFPFYNKFRTPAMILALANLAFVFVAGLAVFELLTRVDSKKDIPQTKKALMWSLAITAGLVFVVGILGSYFTDFSAEGDARLAEAGWPVDALEADRAAMMRGDAFRSLMLILLAGGFIWAFIEAKIKATILLAAVGLLVLGDTWAVSKRYLNDEDFVSKTDKAKYFRPSKADLQIKQDTDLSYRVLNFTTSTFNDALTSYHHKSIGGYHAAKIRRYQDLIEKQISLNMQRISKGFGNDNIPVLNMLNLRYIIGKDDQVIRNPNGMGNAWFVPEYSVVADAAAEMDSLSSFDPARTAFVDKRFESYLSGLPAAVPASGSITLTSYDPEKLTYKSTSTQEQLAVFSEVYYDKGWQASIDGNPVDHIRVNYVLRAMRVPAGEHTIEFVFRPKSYYTGEKFSLAFSALTLLLVLGVIVLEVKKYFS